MMNSQGSDFEKNNLIKEGKSFKHNQIINNSLKP